MMPPKDIIRYIAVNGLFLCLVVYSVLRDTQGTHNAMTGICLVLAILSFLFYTKKVQNQFKEKPCRVPEKIDIAYDVLIVAILGWASWWTAFIAYSIHGINCVLAVRKSKEKIIIHE